MKENESSYLWILNIMDFALLRSAAENGVLDVVKYLIKAEANVNLKTAEYNNKIDKQIKLIYDVVHWFNDVDTQMELFTKIKEYCFHVDCSMFSEIITKIKRSYHINSISMYIELLDSNVNNCNKKELERLNKLKNKYF